MVKIWSKRMKFDFVSSHLQAAAGLDIPYPLMGKTGEIPAAVLALWGCDAQGEACILLTERTHHLDKHQGQIAFPGGRIDPGETAVQAALRENQEEMGIPASLISVQGELGEFLTSTGYRVTPVLSTLGVPGDHSSSLVHGVRVDPNADEIQSWFWVSARQLLAPGVHRQEPFQKGAIRVMTEVYQLEGRRIWGVTGAILKNILDRLVALK